MRSISNEEENCQNIRGALEDLGIDQSEADVERAEGNSGNLGKFTVRVGGYTFTAMPNAILHALKSVHGQGGKHAAIRVLKNIIGVIKGRYK